MSDDLKEIKNLLDSSGKQPIFGSLEKLLGVNYGTHKETHKKGCHCTKTCSNRVCCIAAHEATPCESIKETRQDNV